MQFSAQDGAKRFIAVITDLAERPLHELETV